MSDTNQLFYTITTKPSQIDRILHLVSLYLEEVGIGIKLSLRDVRISNPRAIIDDPYMNTEIDFRIIKSNYKGPKFTVIKFNKDNLEHSLVKVFSIGNNVYHILPVDRGFDDIEDKDYTEIFINHLKNDSSLVLNAIDNVVFKDGKYNISFKDETIFNSDKFVISSKCVKQNTTDTTISEKTNEIPSESTHEAIIEDTIDTPTDIDSEGHTEAPREDLDTTPLNPEVDDHSVEIEDTDSNIDTGSVDDINNVIDSKETETKEENVVIDHDTGKEEASEETVSPINEDTTEAKEEDFYVADIRFELIPKREITRYNKKYWHKQLVRPVAIIIEETTNYDIKGDRVFAVPDEKYSDNLTRKKVADKVTIKRVDNGLVFDYADLETTEYLPELVFSRDVTAIREKSNSEAHVYSLSATLSDHKEVHGPKIKYLGRPPVDKFGFFYPGIHVHVFEDGEVRWLSDNGVPVDDSDMMIFNIGYGVAYHHQVERLNYVNGIYVGDKYVYRSVLIVNRIRDYIGVKEEGDWWNASLEVSDPIVFDYKPTDEEVKNMVFPVATDEGYTWVYADNVVKYTAPKDIYDNYGIDAKVYKVKLSDEGEDLSEKHYYRQSFLIYPEDAAKDYLWSTGAFSNTPVYFADRELTEEEHKAVFIVNTTEREGVLSIVDSASTDVSIKSYPEYDYDNDDTLVFNYTKKDAV